MLPSSPRNMLRSTQPRTSTSSPLVHSRKRDAAPMRTPNLSGPSHSSVQSARPTTSARLTQCCQRSPQSPRSSSTRTHVVAHAVVGRIAVRRAQPATNLEVATMATLGVRSRSLKRSLRLRFPLNHAP